MASTTRSAMMGSSSNESYLAIESSDMAKKKSGSWFYAVLGLVAIGGLSVAFLEAATMIDGTSGVEKTTTFVDLEKPEVAPIDDAQVGSCGTDSMKPPVTRWDEVLKCLTESLHQCSTAHQRMSNARLSSGISRESAYNTQLLTSITMFQGTNSPLAEQIGPLVAMATKLKQSAQTCSTEARQMGTTDAGCFSYDDLLESGYTEAISGIVPPPTPEYVKYVGGRVKVMEDQSKTTLAAVNKANTGACGGVSTLPYAGGAGNCEKADSVLSFDGTTTSWLDTDASCVPTCDAGYRPSGERSCTNGELTNTFKCTAIKCEAEMDVVFVVDGSSSMWYRDGGTEMKDRNFQLSKKFVQDFAKKTKFATTNQDGTAVSGGARMGTILYSWKTKIISPLTSDEDDLNAKLEAMKWPMGGTMTGKALLEAKQLFSLAKGSKNRQKIVVLLTDGQPSNRFHAKQAAKHVRDSGIRLFVVPIKYGGKKEVCSWVSIPCEANVVMAPTFTGLGSKLDEILTSVCPTSME